MDPLQRFLASLEARHGASVAVRVRRLLEAGDQLGTLSHNADADGETITIEVPGERARIRWLTIACATGRVRLESDDPRLRAAFAAGTEFAVAELAGGDEVLADALARSLGRDEVGPVRGLWP